MSALLDQYLAGDHVRVWDELYELDYAQHRDDVDAVADVTMQRLSRNLTTLVTRLRSESFVFHHPDAALRGPDPDSDAKLQRVDSLVSHLEVQGFRAKPLAPSVRAFYRHVGGVDLTGFSRAWPHPQPSNPDLRGAYFFGDGLFVGSLDWVAESARNIPSGSGSLAFSPDIFHKEDVSGGPPYGWFVPSPSPDAFCTELQTAFVPYLRFALQWAGFPGLRLYKNYPQDWIEHLTRDLEPF